MNSISDHGSPASRVESSVFNEVLASSPRPALRGWIIFEDPRPSCPSIPLRGSCHKINTTSGGASLVYLRGYKIEGHLRQSSFILLSREASVMTWHCCAVRNERLYLHYLLFGDSAPEAMIEDEKSLTIRAMVTKPY